MPSHASPDTPGSFDEGGELGYSLVHAYGAAFDNPDLIVRAVMHPHGTNAGEFDSIFTRNVPVIFVYHGYPALIHRLTYKRPNADRFHVRGCREKGSTTTPFEMTVRNGLDLSRIVDISKSMVRICRRSAIRAGDQLVSARSTASRSSSGSDGLGMTCAISYVSIKSRSAGFIAVAV